MGDENDKFELEAKVDGGKVAVSGPGVAKISGQLADLISPFTEIAGLAGDHLRIFRYESVKARLERAKELAEERGEKIRPVHPKNLIPWIEGASLEDEDTDIGELWSRLLLSGTEDFQAEIAMFSEMLKKISRKEAELLKLLCFAGEEKISKNYSRFLQEKALGTNINIILRRLSSDNDLKLLDQDFAYDHMRSICDEVYLPLADIVSIVVWLRSDFVKYYFNRELFGLDQSMDILEREGLVRLRVFEFGESPHSSLAECIEVTHRGLRLIGRCYPEMVEGGRK